MDSVNRPEFQITRFPSSGEGRQTQQSRRLPSFAWKRKLLQFSKRWFLVISEFRTMDKAHKPMILETKYISNLSFSGLITALDIIQKNITSLFRIARSNCETRYELPGIHRCVKLREPEFMLIYNTQAPNTSITEIYHKQQYTARWDHAVFLFIKHTDYRKTFLTKIVHGIRCSHTCHYEEFCFLWQMKCSPKSCDISERGGQSHLLDATFFLGLLFNN
jgi:hypothetical protein